MFVRKLLYVFLCNCIDAYGLYTKVYMQQNMLHTSDYLLFRINLLKKIIAIFATFSSKIWGPALIFVLSKSSKFIVHFWRFKKKQSLSSFLIVAWKEKLLLTEAVSLFFFYISIVCWSTFDNYFLKYFFMKILFETERKSTCKGKVIIMIEQGRARNI